MSLSFTDSYAAAVTRPRYTDADLPGAMHM